MEEIRMVDLKSQYNNIKDEIDTAIKSVIDSTAFIRGKEVGLFEEELGKFLDIANVIACGNGTDALQVALMALDLEPGSEVITTNFTFIATIEVIALLGLKPVLVEPEPGSFNISPEAVRSAISDRTKAIMPVHLFGQCANMEELKTIAQEHGLYLIEDTAQALGADYIFSDGKRSKAGTMSTIATTSFFPSKNLGCYGDGGAIFTNDNNLAGKIRSIVNHGMTKKYYHDYVGVNSRLDTIQAAILRTKLNYLDKYNEARAKAAEQYDKSFRFTNGILCPERSPWSTHIFHQYTLTLDPDDRDSLREFLSLNGIPSMIYYPVPLHQQEAYKYLNLSATDYPITGNLSKRVLSLPMHTELDNDQIDYITSKVLEYFEEI
jgi:UDP-2-acetamido-2-deoxy-ribo-hexuluronate aminotransferase